MRGAVVRDQFVVVALDWRSLERVKDNVKRHLNVKSLAWLVFDGD